MLKMGTSDDYGVCKGKKKDGMACTTVINRFVINNSLLPYFIAPLSVSEVMSLNEIRRICICKSARV